MRIPAISAASPSAAAPATQGGADAQVRALEQQLQKLHTRRQQAIRRHDEDEKKKLEKQIREIEQQLSRLRAARRQSGDGALQQGKTAAPGASAPEISAPAAAPTLPAASAVPTAAPMAAGGMDVSV